MLSEAPIGQLQVRQGEIGNGFTLLQTYDLALTTNSWESRANTATAALVGRSETLGVLRFASSDEDILARKDASLASVTSITGNKFHLINLAPSIDFETNFKKLDGLFEEAFRKAGRPIAVLLDMTCLPKRYILFVIGREFRREQVSRIDILYSEAARYELTPGTSTGTLSLISDGEWTSVQVPYLESEEYVSSKRDLFISLGGELTNAMPFIDRFEPKEMRLYSVENTESRLPKDQFALEASLRDKLTHFPNCYSMSFDLQDVIGVAEDVLRAVRSPTTCFAIGPKPHALAFGLATLANHSLQVVCRSPGRYLASDATPSGRILAYSLEDRFDPRSYWSS